MSNSALLTTDILKAGYWDLKPTSRMSITQTVGTKNNLYPFENCFDGHSGTTWRLNSDGSQQKYTFQVYGAINGVAIYGHNLRAGQLTLFHRGRFRPLIVLVEHFVQLILAQEQYPLLAPLQEQ